MAANVWPCSYREVARTESQISGHARTDVGHT